MPSISDVTPGTIRHAIVPVILLQKLTPQIGTEGTGIKLSNLPHSRVVLERISPTHRRSRVLRLILGGLRRSIAKRVPNAKTGSKPIAM